MFFEYDGIVLEFLEFDTFHRAPVTCKWGVDVLHTEWNVGMLSYFSPTGTPAGVAVETREPSGGLFGATARRVATADRSPGLLRRIADLLRGRTVAPPRVDLRRDGVGAPAGAAPTTARGTAGSGRGFGPIFTDVTLRDRLMTPRRPLRIYGPDWSGVEEAELCSVLPAGEECDPIGGPFNLQCDIVTATDMGFVVYLQYRFATLPCAADAQRLVLSHRYDATEMPTENGYSARRIEGEIVFNGTMIHTFGINADKFRNQYFLPIPLGHERKVEYVRARGDGMMIEYAYTDTEVPITFDAGDSGATHLEISEKLGYYNPSYRNVFTDPLEPTERRDIKV